MRESIRSAYAKAAPQQKKDEVTQLLSTMTKKATSPREKRKNALPAKRMTKEERREKYTTLARQRRDAKLQRERSRQLTCFKCRKHGHAASSCPSASSSNNLCYKCGSTEHTLSACAKVRKGERAVDMDLPFATCFVCEQKGHLASQCERNERGIYVNGGSCRTCGSTKHRANDCPEQKKRSKQRDKAEPTEHEEAMANEVLLHGKGDEQPERKEEAPEVQEKKRRVVKF